MSCFRSAGFETSVISLENLGTEASKIIAIDRADGVQRIVEIGDGQVSDLVGWTAERFVQLWQ